MDTTIVKSRTPQPKQKIQKKDTVVSTPEIESGTFRLQSNITVERDTNGLLVTVVAHFKTSGRTYNQLHQAEMCTPCRGLGIVSCG
jgi:hypothetical protein